MSIQLGKLEKVELRNVWKNEASHFTPWLGSEENIALLSETIGVELEVTSIEQRVGIFRADIICKDVDNDKIVLIENQFEYTDHKHLGQLLTYASGTQAVTMIWIAEHFTEEHRSVLDWLNRITDESTDFFGIEVELYRIGNSEPAPKFNIVSKPNEWSRNLRRAARNVEMTETREIQLEYWQELRKLLDSEPSDYKMHNPSATYFNIITFGREDARIRMFANITDKRIGVIYILRGENADDRFDLLKGKYFDESISIFGKDLEWEFKPGRGKQQIILRLHNTNPFDKEDWKRQHEWLKNNVKKMYDYFSTR